YQDYTTRAKVAVGLANVSFVKERYLDYVVETQAWPTSMRDLAVDGNSGQFGLDVSSVEIGQDNEIRISFSGAQIDGKTIVWVPSVEDQTLVWSCQVETLPAKFAPASCR
ncbi:TPA: pilin, partial [Klebsiella pneumoniae]